MDKVPGIETADYEVAEVEHNVEALTELFKGAKVVCNMVGPFIKYGPETGRGVPRRRRPLPRHHRRAGLDAVGAGENGATRSPRRACCSRPCVAQMYTTGEIAANIALETGPGLDTLDMLVLWKGFPTYASIQTIFTILKADWYYLENNQYVAVADADRDRVPRPRPARDRARPLPWGGTSHPIWFKHDPRVVDGQGLWRRLAREVMDGVVAMTKMIETDIKPLEPSRSRKRRSPRWRSRCRPTCRRARIRASTPASTPSTPRGRSAARTCSSTAIATTSRPG